MDMLHATKQNGEEASRACGRGWLVMLRLRAESGGGGPVTVCHTLALS